MPSKNTSVLAARVKDKTKIILEESAAHGKMTVPRLLDTFADYIDTGTISVDGEDVLGFTFDFDDEIDTSELEKLAAREGYKPQDFLNYLIEKYKESKERF